MATLYDLSEFEKLKNENNVMRMQLESQRAHICELTSAIDRLQPMVSRYFEERHLVEPDAEQAFLFLISEMGELAEAYLANAPQNKILESLYIFLQMSGLGKSADLAVSRSKAEWVRNHDRHKVSKPGEALQDELADVLMMIDRLAFAVGEDATLCLINKMIRKCPPMKAIIHEDHA